MNVRKSIGKVILVSLLLHLFFFNQQEPRAFAEEDLKNTIEKYVESYLEEQRIPGASIAIVKDKELFFSQGWGVTGESEEEVTTQTPFTVGSISKSLTGLAVMKLIEEGTVQLDDPIQMYLPWFSLKDKEAASKITIVQLLTQTSGISTYSGLLLSDQGSQDFNTIKNNVESLSDTKLTATPGEKHQYSNANYLILGALIEEVTNQTYSEYMEEQVFSPLGMNNAAADNDTAYERGYLAGYQSWFGIPRKSSVTYDNGGAPYGYITASADDMVQIIHFLSQQDGNSLLNEKYMNLYLTPHVQTGDNRFYGLGVRISNPYSEDKIVWHSGSTPDSHSEVFYLPDSKWGGVILTNKNHALEEVALVNLKQGMINILHGDDPVEISKFTPILQLIILGIVVLLIMLFVYRLITVKSVKVRRRKRWSIIGMLLLVLAFAIKPVFSYSVGSPWHSIKVFGPDVAFLTNLMMILLALNGILSIYISLKYKRSKEHVIAA
ncbi:serine hydrolase domain-containing protein [Bacillus sp. SM2101]|uniref:serine hydrolase domain-containing protein n=1 Tax=Bacillus sp. SM2101 TaxID=2805366 RepID=UPI001BDE4E59|nr:serine hydrolase domain-containing protein [Bacillus sp. SM2101]